MSDYDKILELLLDSNIGAVEDVKSYEGKEIWLYVGWRIIVFYFDEDGKLLRVEKEA